MEIEAILTSVVITTIISSVISFLFQEEKVILII